MTTVCPGKPSRKQAVTGIPILQEGLTYMGSGKLPESRLREEPSFLEAGVKKQG